ncbi:MAG TPA: tetratricopeptide repeat protein [Alphaproteobacteria bacterium]|nr:tetratricopeptide repeat protein [Alphaproteobacteria bacterium]
MSPRSQGGGVSVRAQLAAAALHHRAGRLAEAAAACETALSIERDSVDALHFLGVLKTQLGQTRAAIPLLSRAAELAPDNAEIQLNLGNVLRECDRPRDAIPALRRAAELAPNIEAARIGLAGAFAEAGEYAEAAAAYRAVLARTPGLRIAWVNLGRVLEALGNLDEAAANLERALTMKPDDLPTMARLAGIEERRARPAEAFWLWRGAARRAPDSDEFWRGMARALRDLRFDKVDPELESDLLGLLAQPAVDPADIAPAIASYVRAIARATSADEALVRPLLTELLAAAIVADPEIETWLTTARRAALAALLAGRTPAHSRELLVAIAQQCYATEYVYAETESETAQIAELTRRAVMAPDAIDERELAVLAAYRPLNSLDIVDVLARRAWSAAITALVERQIVVPRAEAIIREQIVAITPLDDVVSRKVRMQYEENPYPVWRRPDWSGAPTPLGAELRRLFPHARPPDSRLDGKIDVLIAGCGTGRHSCGSALRFADARILAIDLSRTSLAYAIRKARELGIANIEHAQADILALDGMERRFDMIECGGVLHHLADPLAGWRILERLLRPGGYMRIALYSERARAPAVAARRLIEAHGFAPTAEGIRCARAALLAEADETVLPWMRHNPDFYAMSGCRDLLFHVQEHRLTLPRIAAMLRTLGLNFVGFEFADARIPSRYRLRFPDDPAMTDLGAWDRFEAENPTTFAAMYQFWIGKTGA